MQPRCASGYPACPQRNRHGQSLGVGFKYEGLELREIDMGLGFWVRARGLGPKDMGLGFRVRAWDKDFLAHIALGRTMHPILHRYEDSHTPKKDQGSLSPVYPYHTPPHYPCINPISPFKGSLTFIQTCYLKGPRIQIMSF